MAARYGPLGIQASVTAGMPASASMKPPPGAENKPPRPVKWQKKGYTTMVLILNCLPDDTTTHDIHRSLDPLTVVSIDLLEDESGKRSGSARVRLVPPLFDYWYDRTWWLQITGPPMRSVHVHAQVDARGFSVNYDQHIRTPLNRWVSANIDLRADLFGQGFMYQRQTMMVMDEVTSTKEFAHHYTPSSVSLEVNFNRRQLTITVTRYLKFEKASGAVVLIVKPIEYRIELRFAWIKRIWEQKFPGDRTCLIIAMDSPPPYWRKTPVITESHASDKIRWNGNDQWCRMALLTTSQRAGALRGAPVSLEGNFPDGQGIDLGRWTTFRLGLDEANAENWRKAAEHLRDYDIHVRPTTDFRFLRRDDRNMWACMSGEPKALPQSPGIAAVPQTAASLSPSNVHRLSRRLSFEVAYQLEVCLSHGIFHENTLDVIFMQSLAALSPDRATRMLEYLAERGKRVYHPHNIFRDPKVASYWRKTPVHPIFNKDQAVHVRKALVTPTTVVYDTPALEGGNRVLRHFRDQQDRFLRVQFTDELVIGRLNAGSDSNRTDNLFLRAFRALKNGIRVGGRHFEFLAFGNSQLRESSAYFFAPTELISCDDIRDWMGDFSSIKTVAKYAARLGQCLSTTRPVPTFGAPTALMRIDDVERDGFCFTDGIGKISGWWARTISSHLRVDDVPSAVQFRLGGCKGVLAVWPDVPPGQVIQVRPSQEKFPTTEKTSNVLEIVRCSETASATLNQQVILLLTALGVPAPVFLELLEEELTGLDAVMNSPRSAVSQLMMRIDQNQVTPVIADMVKAGFMRSDEPFVWALLQLWRSWTLKFLKDKARITVEKSAFVLGCVDETDTLRGHTEGSDALPQIFLQVPDLDADDQHSGFSLLSRGGGRAKGLNLGRNIQRTSKKYRVITGLCLVGRNPSLHPGDMRVVEAVDVPELRHLRDVVVFPRTGDQDLPSMCSGGDLDGDDYFVFWDQRMLPPRASWNHAPMDYEAVREPQVDDITTRHLISFFVQHMKHDTLSQIALAHRGFADQLDGGALHPKCLELAQLHSQAVDFAKTGLPAMMPQRLRPNKWPHWMNRQHKQSYQSNTALGHLYDRVQIENFEPAYDKPFDARILTYYPSLDAAMLKRARVIKTKYDLALRRAMAQREIETEFEIWTGFSLSRPRVGTDYKVAEDIGRLYKVIMTRFRRLCLREVEGSYDIEKLGPFVAAMYTVTYQELRIALHQFAVSRKTASSEDDDNGTEAGGRFDQSIAPLISFPWLFARELAMLASAAENKLTADDSRSKTKAVSGEEEWAKAVPASGPKDKTSFVLTEEELEAMQYKVYNGVPTHYGIPLDVSAYAGSREDEDEGGPDEGTFEPMWTLPPGVSEGDIIIKPTAVANEEAIKKEEEDDEEEDFITFSSEAEESPLAKKDSAAPTEPFPWAEIDDDVLSTTSEEEPEEDRQIVIHLEEDDDDNDDKAADDKSSAKATAEDMRLMDGFLEKKMAAQKRVGDAENSNNKGAAEAMQKEEEDASDEGSDDEDQQEEDDDDDAYYDDDKDAFAEVSDLFDDRDQREQSTTQHILDMEPTS